MCRQKSRTVRTKTRQILFFVLFDFIFRTLAIIKPDAVRYLGDIISAVYENGFTIARMRMVRLAQNEAMFFYSEHKSKEFYPYVLFWFVFLATKNEFI